MCYKQLVYAYVCYVHVHTYVLMYTHTHNIIHTHIGHNNITGVTPAGKVDEVASDPP